MESSGIEADISGMDISTEVEPEKPGDDSPEMEAWHSCALRRETVSSHIMDEIALEGLDGITLQALQVRLRNRPGLPMLITAKSMVKIWRILTRLQGLEFYELPEAREDLLVYNREDFVDERGCLYEPLSAPQDIYIYHPVQKFHIRGSCQHFETRKPVPHLRVQDLDDVIRTYGNKLVLVASQKNREEAILGRSSEGAANLSIIQYCMLERIARARYDGELTRGKVSLSVMKIEAKALFYQRKYMLRKNMITKQVFAMKFGETRANSLISVLHLPRFYRVMLPAAVLYAKRLYLHLISKPGMREESMKIKKMFGKTMFKTLISPEFKELFQEQDIPVAELQPEIFAEELNKKKRESMLKRTQKAVVFLNPPGDFESYLPQLREPDLKGKEPKSEKNTFLWGVLRDNRATLFDTPMHLTQELISCAESSGVTLMQIRGILRLHTLAARSGGRLAVKLKLANATLVEKKKTKAYKYTPIVPFKVPKDLVEKYSTQLRIDEEATMASTLKQSKKAVKAAKLQMKSKKRGNVLNNTDNNISSDNMDKPSFGSMHREEFITPEMRDEETVNRNSAKFNLKRPRSRKQVLNKEGQMVNSAQEHGDGESPSKMAKPVVQERGRDPTKRLARLLMGRKTEAKLLKKYAPRKKKVKIMSVESLYYDDKDVEALARKNRLRVNWKASEDRMILLFYISSVVFIPKYNLKKLFIFNATQIRDMLHMKSDASRNKTSLAIRRRFHFLMRSQAFRLQYVQYLHDAVNDTYIKNEIVDPVRREYEEPNKIFYNVPMESILKVYHYLSEKHKNELDVYRKVPSTLKALSKVQKPSKTANGNAREPATEEDPLAEDRNVTEERVQENGLEGFKILEIESWLRDGNHEIIVDAVKDPQSVDEIELWIGRTLMLSLMFCGSDYHDAETFLSRVEEKKLDFVSHHVRRLNICTLVRTNRKLGLSINMRKKLSYHLNPGLYKLAKSFLEEARRKFLTTFPAVTTSLAALYSVIDHLMEDKARFVIQLNAEYAAQDWSTSTRFFSTANPSRIRKNKPAEGDDTASVTLPRLMAKIDEPEKNYQHLNRCEEFLLNQFFQVVRQGGRPPFPEKYGLLYTYIHSSQELGISLKLLQKTFEASTLSTALHYLMREKYIFTVGITQRKFVCDDFIESWTIKFVESTEEYGVIMHPWITSAGEVNWGLVDWLLTSILGILTRHPGMQVRRIVTILNPVVSSVELAMLLEVLLHFDFINTYKVYTERPEAFSDRTSVTYVPVEDSYLELEDLHVELKQYSHTKYSMLQDILSRLKNPSFVPSNKNDQQQRVKQQQPAKAATRDRLPDASKSQPQPRSLRPRRKPK